MKFIESSTWKGGPQTGDEWDWLGPSLGVSPRKARKKPTPKATRDSGKMRGTVARWDSERNYGFVTPDAGGPSIFLHSSELKRSNIDRVTYGTRIAFEIAEGKQGKPQAVKISSI